MTPFDETLTFFSTQLGAPLPEDTIGPDGVELAIEGNPVSLYPGALAGSLVLEVPLALISGPKTTQLDELCALNYLGAETGGCTLTLDDLDSLISLKIVTSPGTSAMENWDALHRLMATAQHLIQKFTPWENITPLFELEEKPHE